MMAGYPVANPPLPYTAPIDGGCMSVGKMIYIQGFVPHGAGRFEVNLYTGPGEPNDIALHMNPRFEGTNAVVRTHRERGSYGKEERHGNFPFAHGQSFEIILLCEHDRYKIAVNGQHCFEFVHRIPKERVTFLNVEGSVQITSIRQQGGFPAQQPSYQPPPMPQPSYQPPPAPYQPAPAPYQPPAMPPQPLRNPRVPARLMMPGGMFAGRSVTIQGRASYGASRFTVNLKAGGHESADLGLHFDVRFNYGDAHNVVVRTHRENGSYGPEDRHAPTFPFKVNHMFTLQIVSEPSMYRVHVNGAQFCEFYHRLQPSTRADHVEISGDVVLTLVQAS